MAFREGPFNDLKLPVAWLAIGATAVAILIALMLLLSERKATVAMSGHAPVRDAFDKVIEPVSGALEAPVRWTGDAIGYVEGYFFAVSQNRKLRQEVRELEGARDAAIALKNVNDRYEALLKLKTEPPVPMVTGRTIVDVRGPFSNARLIDTGSASGVQVGDPAMSEHGVVGRVVGVTRGVSRLLMVTDVDSRTPVLVDRSNGRAILTGDGSAYPRMEYVRGRDPVKVGDIILTSGDGGVFPRGLPVGVAVKDLKGGWRVRLYSDETPIDFVRVLLFQAFSQSAEAQALTGGEATPPPLTSAEAADRAAALQRAAPTPAAPPPAGLPTASPPAAKATAGRARHAASAPVPEGATPSPPVAAPIPTPAAQASPTTNPQP
jgi:rod shape-determining protein MreC